MDFKNNAFVGSYDSNSVLNPTAASATGKSSLTSNGTISFKNNATVNYSVEVAKPECRNVAPIKLVDLDISRDDDVACFVSSASQNPGLAPPPSSGNSVCAYAQWQLDASVNDSLRSAASVTVHQGIGQRVSIGTSC